ncbi:MAG: 4-(cytidine 5'-diphospho)-2-C-methyl-D-erythritol kinase [Treponema sp.]|nr:4-(cytidine 5'-diphospho)-2-C-methyl-D-erythritol kinase [Treponema sp.]
MNFSIFAPAKVNLHLAVKDKRPDGFHNLESVFLAVNFGDTLFFSSVPAEEDTLLMEWENTAAAVRSVPKADCTVPNNIILRALSLFREETGFLQTLSINVVKRIPIGGGLGGGSSDAAATLLALNKMAGSPLGTELLFEMGTALGSDVPFFLRQIPAAWVTGRGECIKPIETPHMYLVLVNPGFSSDTGAAFRLLDKYRNSVFSSSADFSPTRLCKGYSFSLPSFRNDFLPVFEDRVKTIYNKIISQLLESGALYANLSGTGSTCFGVFENEEQAQRAAEVMQNDWDFVKVTVTFTKNTQITKSDCHLLCDHIFLSL